MKKFPRLPLEGRMDLTYRCNNRCRHCWLSVPENAAVQKEELRIDEIRRIVDQARSMGCRYWSISGGEPLLRPDFPDIFDYLTRKATGYTLNTNGTLITPETARLLTRRGSKMIALYGATKEVYDQVTRHPGGFEKVMQAFAYLKEAGAGFIVQLVPMKANWHQWDKMIALAESLSPHWRVGAPWLFLSSEGSPQRNREIIAQRLSPSQVIEVDRPNPGHDETMKELKKETEPGGGAVSYDDDRLFADCIAERQAFHIDPYGLMSWCSYIKDPTLRYDLRKGTFEEAWERFIPECAEKVHGGKEWREHCGSCEKRSDCRWCAVYAYLETGRYSAPIPYLCEVAEEARKFKEKWRKKHRRYFRIAGITVCVESHIDFAAIKFKDELMEFAVEGPGEDNVRLRHSFELPDIKGRDLGTVLYRIPPWEVSYRNGTWFYRGISPSPEDHELRRLAVFNAGYTRGIIYHSPAVRETVLKYGWPSLSLLATDQIWLGPLLADRNAVLIHSSAAVINGRGFLFAGHSDAGKSTTMEILRAASHEYGLNAEILCDDRNVLRLWKEEWRVYGTWSHGTTADVSSSSAPLEAVLFLEQAEENEIIPLKDRKMIWGRLLPTLIRPMVTAEWWQKELDALEQLVNKVPCYIMRFDKTDAIIKELKGLIH
ncbi:MAG: radical SAM protein [Candidatus Aminicenantes bacterium]